MKDRSPTGGEDRAQSRVEIDRRSRWRRSQRRRLRRLTRRGQATLAASVGLVGLGSAGVWISLADDHGTAETAPPSVSALAPEQLIVPAEVFERLPVSKNVLDFAAVSFPDGSERFEESVTISDPAQGPARTIRIAYSFDPELTRNVHKILRLARVDLGHVIVSDPATGRVLAYASTNLEQFPPTRTYPAASLVKVITAAAALDRDPDIARLPCRYRGSPYRLTRSRIDPPRSGHEVSLRKALASSNNQCFAQLAVHAIGGDSLLDAISRFGWLSEPGPAHPAGSADPGEDRYSVGRLGCGLAGCRITPLHAVQLASSLVRGEIVAPRWIARVRDASGAELALPALAPPRRVMTEGLASELREMLVDTTRKGTARRAFRGRNGRPLLGPVEVAGKTGSLSGKNPDGRYEWFAGVAPAEEPTVAIAVLLVQSELWWRNASQVAAEVLKAVFCEGRKCLPSLAGRWIRSAGGSDRETVDVSSADWLSHQKSSSAFANARIPCQNPQTHPPKSRRS
jgi:hypothetical protein